MIVEMQLKLDVREQWPLLHVQNKWQSGKIQQ